MAGPSAQAMASIEGVSNAFSKSLGSVQVGDLILIESRPNQNMQSDAKSASDNSDAEEGEVTDGVGSANADQYSNGGESMMTEEGADQSEGAGTNAVQSAGPGAVEAATGTGEAVHDHLSAGADDGAGQNDDAALQHIPYWNQYEPRLYRIHPLQYAKLYITDAVEKDEGGHVTDLTLCELHYEGMAMWTCENGFRILGDVVILHHPGSFGVPYASTGKTNMPPSMSKTATIHKSINEVANEDTCYAITCNPKGDDIRNIMFDRCTGGCEDGWLADRREFGYLMYDPIVPVDHDYTAVCPVCIGRELAKDFHTLQMRREESAVDMTDVIDYYFRLNPRRVHLGYEFKQFDEREWGYHFDDVLSEDEDGEGDDGEGRQWEQWDDAMDPNAGAVFRPAAKEAINNLDRRRFAELSKDVKEEACLICRTDFEADDVVVTMPCAHIFCASGCLDKWLKTSNTCPTCRSKLPEAKPGSVAENGQNIPPTAEQLRADLAQSIGEFEAEGAVRVAELRTRTRNIFQRLLQLAGQEEGEGSEEPSEGGLAMARMMSEMMAGIYATEMYTADATQRMRGVGQNAMDAPFDDQNEAAGEQAPGPATW